MFLKSGLVSLTLLLFSRLLGVARESAQAAAFGTSAQADVVVLMLMFPDWLAGLVAGGALAYVLLPHWARQDAQSVAVSQRLVGARLLTAGVLMGLCLLPLAVYLMDWLVPGLQGHQVPGADRALWWSGLALPAALLAALWTARLQHERDFIGMYGANLVINAVLVVALVWLAMSQQTVSAITQMGGALLTASLLRLLWLRWRLPAAVATGSGVYAEPVQGPGEVPARMIWVWAILAAGLPLALPFAARSMASQSGEGALATFNYAWKLVELPLVLAVQMAASLAFPVITQAFARNDNPAMAVRSAFSLAWALACAAAAGLLVGATAAAELLFGWGRMGPQGLMDIASWSRVGAWGLLPQGLTAVALVVLATLGRLRCVALAYGAALAFLLLLHPWANSDGARLMALLNAAQWGVAVSLVALLGVQARAWLPWRSMTMMLGLLGLVAMAFIQFEVSLLVLPLAAQLGLSVLAVVVLMGGVWASDAELRHFLRR